MTIQAAFDFAVKTVRELPPDGEVKPSQDDQLAFYGHFKQATDGDCTGSRPGAFDFKGKYKYDAWKKLEGTSKADAQAKYVELLENMLAKASDAQSQKLLEELRGKLPN